MTEFDTTGTAESTQSTTQSKQPFLATVNPVARVLGLFLLTTPLLISIDWVSAVVALVCTLFLVPLSGLGFRRTTLPMAAGSASLRLRN